MFRSATLKLTAWYLAILMSISVIFSIVIFQLNFHEVGVRLENLQQALIDTSLLQKLPETAATGGANLITTQSEQAAFQMLLSLIYINIILLITGGIASYFLARRTLRPLELAHEAQSRFTSDASHELRTPLAAMKAELEVTLRDKALDPAETRALLESNLEEVNKLIQLSEMLLKLSRLDYDQLERKQLDLVDLFQSQLRFYPKQSKRFELSTRKKKIIVYGNEAAIGELMNILIDNALKYSSPRSSKIAVRIFERRLMGGFEISNSGPTIPAEKVPKLFERFYRADTSRTQSNENGYGLGLAIAKKIVDIHHGDLQVISKAKTTTFTFFIPTTRMIAANALTDGKITTK